MKKIAQTIVRFYVGKDQFVPWILVWILLVIVLGMVWLGKVDVIAAFGLIGIIIAASLSASVSIYVLTRTQKNALQMAALDKRLQALQDAYKLWSDVARHIHQEDSLIHAIEKANNWWTENCLYLDATSRESFRRSLIAAGNHKNLLESRSDPNWKKEVDENWDIIRRVPTDLIEAAYLRPLSDLEIDVPSAFP